MRGLIGYFGVSTLLAVAWVPVAGQMADSTAANPAAQNQPVEVPSQAMMQATGGKEQSPAVQALLAFKETDVKFSVAQLMDILRDKRHEGWVLAAYPDPKTTRPLIGAGFSLDLPAREHPQTDALNPNPFFEPSSAELWQAAGLDAAQLAKILDQFHAQLAQWRAKRFRKNIGRLEPQITEEDANKLLRVAIVQSVLNARAYCRNFDSLTASQQMAVSQLVYQMGVNLGQFSQFLALMNGVAPQPVVAGEPVIADGAPELRDVAMQSVLPVGPDYWKSVQQSLVQSQWARLYRARAVAVIAMFDPKYADSPTAAERRVSAVLRPAARRRHARRAGTELAASRSTRARSGHSKGTRATSKKAALAENIHRGENARLFD